MDRGYPAFSVNQESNRQRLYIAVLVGRLGIPQQDTVAHSQALDERLHLRPAILILRYAKDRETLVLILLLEFVEPGDLRFAWDTPGSPEIHQYDLALILGQPC